MHAPRKPYGQRPFWQRWYHSLMTWLWFGPLTRDLRPYVPPERQHWTGTHARFQPGDGATRGDGRLSVNDAASASPQRQPAGTPAVQVPAPAGRFAYYDRRLPCTHA